MKSSGFKTQNKKASGLRSTPIWATNPYSDSAVLGEEEALTFIVPFISATDSSSVGNW